MSQDLTIDGLLEEFLERFRAGQRPALTEYTEKYPALAEEIRELFPAAVVMENFGPEQAAAPEKQPQQRLGDYRLLREVGRGGMGVVYEAVQESLGRHVALKILSPGLMRRPHDLMRFRREAQAAARLHHTNIVPVFGVGEQEGTHYYAMQFIDGHPLNDVLREVSFLRRNPRSIGKSSGSTASLAATGSRSTSVRPAGTEPTGETSSSSTELLSGSRHQYYRSVAEVGLQVAEALGYAHQQGVLHRDIKPSNLLLDSRGTVWVTDFGLAKSSESDDLTKTGDVIGTIRYMAPERFTGTSDVRSDVYALGLTLYEMLALRPAFDAGDGLVLMEFIRTKTPPPPHQFDSEIPRDLETIVLKAMAKEPGARYADAAALAEDLRRFLQDRPIRARRANLAERARQWCRRNPAPALVILLMLVIAVGSPLAALFWRQQRDEARENLSRALDAEKQSRDLWDVYYRQVTQAQPGRWRGTAGQRTGSLQAIQAAVRLLPSLNLGPDHERALRNEAALALSLPDLQPGPRQPWHPDGTTHLTFDPTLQYLARSHTQGQVSVQRCSDGTLVEMPETMHGPTYLTFSPDGHYLAAAHAPHGNEDNVRVWRWQDRRLVLSCKEDLVAWSCYAFHAKEPMLFTARKDKSVGRYHLESGTAEPPWQLGFEGCALACHPQGRELAVSSHGNGMVTVLDTTTGRRLRNLTHPRRVQALAWRPQGDWLAAACFDGKVYLHGPSQRVLALEGHQAEVVGVTFDHRGHRLASHGWDGTLRYWDLSTQRLLVTAHGTYQAAQLQFSPDDRQLAFGYEGNHVWMWNVLAGDEYRVLSDLSGRHEANAHHDLCYTPDSSVLLSASNDGVRLWDSRTGSPLGFLPIDRTECVLSGPDWLITGGDRGTYTWPIAAAAGAEAASPWGPPRRLAGPVLGRAALHPRYESVAFTQEAAGYLHPLGASERPRALLDQIGIAHYSFSADGRWLATGCWHGQDVVVREATTGEPIKRLPFPHSVGVTFSMGEHSAWLVTCTYREFTIWRTADWAPVLRVPRQLAGDRPGSAAFSPDGLLLALAVSDAQVQLHDARTLKPLLTLEPPDQLSVGKLAFSPDSRCLASTGSGNRVLAVWEVGLIREQLRSLGLDWPHPMAPAPSRRTPETIQVNLGTLRPASRTTANTNLQEELAKWNRQLAQNPDDGDSYHWRGHVYERLQKYALARDDYAKAIQRAPKQGKLYLDRAVAHLGLKDYPAAWQDLEQAVGLQADLAPAHFYLGLMHYLGQGQAAAAAKALPHAERAAALDRSNRTYARLLAAVHLQLKQPGKTIEVIEQSQQAEQYTAADWYLLALAHQAEGRAPAASAAFEKGEAKVAMESASEFHSAIRQSARNAFGKK